MLVLNSAEPSRNAIAGLFQSQLAMAAVRILEMNSCLFSGSVVVIVQDSNGIMSFPDCLLSSSCNISESS